MTTSPAGDAGSIDEETREDALDVLSDVYHWRLPSTRWTQVSTAMRALETALAAQDVAAVRAATADLELCGPVRATRIGAEPGTPPHEVRDRVNTLVYSLGGREEPAPDEAPDRGDTD
jgi:hypothetical protein